MQPPECGPPRCIVRRVRNLQPRKALEEYTKLCQAARLCPQEQRALDDFAAASSVGDAYEALVRVLFGGSPSPSPQRGPVSYSVV